MSKYQTKGKCGKCLAETTLTEIGLATTNPIYYCEKCNKELENEIKNKGGN
jgi:hypothetical protein